MSSQSSPQIVPNRKPSFTIPQIHVPAPSSASQKSQDDASITSSAAGPLASPVTNNAQASDDLKRPAAPTKKPTMTSRISGMFSRKDGEASKDSSKSNLAEKMREMSVVEKQETNTTRTGNLRLHLDRLRLTAFREMSSRKRTPLLGVSG